MKFLYTAFLIFLLSPSFAQLRVDIYPTEEFMVTNMLIGNNSVKVWNVEFGGNHDARGVFYNRDTQLTIEEGIILSTGNAIDSESRNRSQSYTGRNGTRGDKELSKLANRDTYDATWISFEFEAEFNLIKFDYVFASEEYPEYVGSAFNDVFGFFLTDLGNGQKSNLAVIPNSRNPITVNNINHKEHSNFYISNSDKRKAQIEYDGLTEQLTAFSQVVPGRKYRIKIAIADVADDAYDSAVFLKGKSFLSQPRSEFFKNNAVYFDAIENEKIAVDSNYVRDEDNDDITTQFSPPDSIIILFNFDEKTPIESSLIEAQKELLEAEFQNYQILVVGHTDVHGNQEYNINLSKNRAEFVSEWLSHNYGIKDIELQYKSYNQLVRQKSSEKGDARNRRVVIYFNDKSIN